MCCFLIEKKEEKFYLKQEVKCARIEAWEAKLEIMTDQRTYQQTDRETDGHEGSQESFTCCNKSKNAYIRYMHMNIQTQK